MESTACLPSSVNASIQDESQENYANMASMAEFQGDKTQKNAQTCRRVCQKIYDGGVKIWCKTNLAFVKRISYQQMSQSGGCFAASGPNDRTATSVFYQEVKRKRKLYISDIIMNSITFLSVIQRFKHFYFLFAFMLKKQKISVIVDL